VKAGGLGVEAWWQRFLDKGLGLGLRGECADLEFLEPFELQLAKSNDQGGCAKLLMPSLRPAKKVWRSPTPVHTKGPLFTPDRCR
jgi:hypothetical protein